MAKINNLILELNSACNNQCIYCYLPEHKDFGEGSLTFFKDKLKKYSKKGIKNIDLTGGEPALYKDLIEIIAYAKKLGYPNRTLVSNGKRLAYENYCQRLVAAGINRFVFCLDGPNDKIFDKVTKAKGSYSLVAQAIKNIKKINKKIEVCATIVVNVYNYRYIPEIIAQAEKLGVDFMNIQHILAYIKDKKIKCKRLPAKIIVPYKRSFPYVAKALKKYGKKFKINVHFIPFCYLPGFEEHLLKESLKFDRLAIHYNGFEYNIGKHVQKGCVKVKKCQKCPYNKYCLGFFESYKKELGIKELI